MNSETLLQSPLDEAERKLRQNSGDYSLVPLDIALEIVQTLYTQMVVNALRVGLAGLDNNYKEIGNLLNTEKL